MHFRKRSTPRRSGVACTVVAMSMTIGGLASTAACSAGTIESDGPLRDFDKAAEGPFDDARAEARIITSGDGSTVEFGLRRVDPAVAGHEFGAHLHLGPCVTDDDAAALGHYNSDVVAGRTPPRIDQTTEVWLDFVVDLDGRGEAVAQVPFVPEPGDRSIVVHEHGTVSDGTAGPRLACLPMEW